ncbi:hypothetical protein PN419_00400 [Halorubrum ezzemoulense]|uniref:hypothetical protein n=1 Tax=Halorubrum ezzemoulense TaxID=337243 RepID=UPI00232DEA20|nr:hypothetical protein [Halorubrum ezzemoulense]MDB9247467.1 hypothetical protein [Halorubrum ezzemoulense]MDB9258624.1 hypothetical protein [Halorubrum ezzemoulense]MDB9264518.1 hypothetical protein [Halorubrum ezzemoulense]MDB9268985.1 hypothetical protein [Halorubrum ezzemoulense]MDB9271486.1 hypothetical protein [Halorubrum ezzemoulense]
MDETDSNDTLTPAQEQLLRAKFRIEAEFAAEHGFDGEPTRSNVREFILDCTAAERRALQRRKRQQFDELTTLMDADDVAPTDN